MLQSTNTTQKLKLLLYSALTFICLHANAQNSPLGAAETDIGAGFTHTQAYNGPYTYSGGGVIIRSNVSLIGMLTNLNSNHRLVLGDYLGSGLFLGIRESSTTNPLGSTATGLGEGFWLGGSFEWGLQGYYKLTSNIDVGMKYYFYDIFDNGRDQSNGPGDDDNVVIKFQVRYSKIMGEYGYSKTPYSAGDKKQKWYSMCLKYFPDPGHSSVNYGIRWESFYVPKLSSGYYYNNNTQTPIYNGFSSFHIDVFYGWMF